MTKLNEMSFGTTETAEFVPDCLGRDEPTLELILLAMECLGALNSSKIMHT